MSENEVTAAKSMPRRPVKVEQQPFDGYREFFETWYDLRRVICSEKYDKNPHLSRRDVISCRLDPCGTIKGLQASD